MGHDYSNTITPDYEKGHYLKFEDRVSIKIYRQQVYSVYKVHVT